MAAKPMRTGSLDCALTKLSAACESRLAPNAVEQNCSGSAGGKVSFGHTAPAKYSGMPALFASATIGA